MDSDPRRAYLAKHGVEAAVTAAITKTLEKQPVEPVSEVGRCLLDAAYVVPAGVTMVPVLDYVSAHGVKTAVSAAIKEVASSMPADPLTAIGRKLAAGGAAPMSEYMAYWAPTTFAKSGLKSEKAFNESLKMTLGKRNMMEREARGIVDPDVPRSEYMEYWAPRTFDASALPNKKAFTDALKQPWGKRCMMEREARGYTEIDTAPPVRSEYEEYWAPRDFKDSALPTEKIFMDSLRMPAGARAMLERDARGIVDLSLPPKKSEYDAYWAPSHFKDSALTSEAAFTASLTMPAGKRNMMEREARGIIDPDVPRSEYMEYWAPRTYKASAMEKQTDFEASQALPWGARCMAEREARLYDDFGKALAPRSEYLDYWAPRDFTGSAMKTEAAFQASLKLPMGTRSMMEREARGVVLVA